MRVEGVANTSPLTRLVCEPPFFCVALAIAVIAIVAIGVTVACRGRRPCDRRARERPSRDRRLSRSSSSRPSSSRSSSSRSSRRCDRHVVTIVTSLRSSRRRDRHVVAIVASSRSSRRRDRRILASPASENRLIVACVFRIARSPPSPHAIDGGRSVCPPHARCSRRRVRALSFEPVARSSLSRSSLQRSWLQHRVSSLRK